MYKNIVCNFILIFIIIKCVKSQDNNPDQPADDEEDEDNFEVLDLDKIIQQRLDRFEDPQYQPEPTYYQPQQYPVYQPQQYDQYLPQQFGHYQPQQYDHYQPYQTQTSQPQSQQQQHDHYQPYEPTAAQPTQPQTQPQQYPGYQPESYTPYQTPQQQVTQPEQYYQHYGPPSYDPYQHIPTYPPGYQTQPMEHYEPQPQPQSETLEDEEDFYVTEHDQPYPQQEPQQPQQPIKPRKRARKRKDPQAPEEQGDEQPRKRRRPVKKTIDIKFYKKDSDGKLVEMINEDYKVTYDDRNKTKYDFILDLERIEYEDQIIYENKKGAPYCSSLTYSKKTKIVVMTFSDVFLLIKKTKESWKTISETTPDYVRMFTQNEEGNYVLMTKEHYKVTFTSHASFRYELHPGVKCYKIVVKWLTAWEKTDNDAEFPIVIYVTNKLSLIINFDSYTKMFERRPHRYRMLYNKKTLGRRKYK
ncbi:SVSP family protein [Theileria parva strain Muguga]|uniref:Theileria-specific sub-telomeric protein, SVSP family n=1 Tax=Theileria parva TaxID=5875 RepID=Q4N3H5_THEPA|nr:SVSP family protein [Theileria parva strain Muguga]EAN31360.1 SVSP family protein [Theileria parva strain Muguga]|eukprot:XP_763643.1 hypothetical protein [Theileria parva strain Muguga]